MPPSFPAAENDPCILQGVQPLLAELRAEIRIEVVGSGILNIGSIVAASPRRTSLPVRRASSPCAASRGRFLANRRVPELASPAWRRAQDATEVYLGFPEHLFVRINAVLPGVVERLLRKALPEYARPAGGTT